MTAPRADRLPSTADLPRRLGPADPVAACGPVVPWRLEPAVQHYAWGAKDRLPDLLGVPQDGRPWAEAWFGAHPAAPAFARERDRDLGALDQVLRSRTAALGGHGTLPFLVKLLAAATPLSIQVHPDAEAAATGFAMEDAAGVPVEAPGRRFRDPNAKPEVLCALGPFEALAGVRSPADAARRLRAAGLTTLAATVRSRGVQAAVEQVLRLPARAAAELAGTAAGRDPLAARLQAHHPGDPGVVLALMLREVQLADGEALYLPPRVPHAYLSGLAVEVLGSSDNVLRAGLTTKPVDVDTFLALSDLRPSLADVLTPHPSGGLPVRGDRFRIRRHDGGVTHAVRGPAIVVCVEDHVVVGSGTAVEPLGPGEGAFLPAGAPTDVVGPGRAFVVTAPHP